jgi:hypothetical protein
MSDQRDSVATDGHSKTPAGFELSRSESDFLFSCYSDPVFTELPKATTQAEIEALLPLNIVRETRSVAA